MHRRTERAHHDRGDEVAGDGGGGLHAEQQDQHRHHQRASAGPVIPTKKPIRALPRNRVRIDVYGAPKALEWDRGAPAYRVPCLPERVIIDGAFACGCV
jgi:hypothetical protein